MTASPNAGSPSRSARAAFWAVCALLCVAFAACDREPAPEHYAARVGSAYLTEAELRDALTLLPAGADSAEARQQLLEEWVTNEVLSQEALSRGLREKPEVERVLRENEQSVLIAALIDELLDEQNGITFAEVGGYFEANEERFRLREPFVRVRYLRAASRDSAQVAREALQQAVRANAVDSLWPGIAMRFAEDAAASSALADQYVPVSDLFANTPALAERAGVMGPNEIAPVLEADGAFHVIQLVARAEEGTLPELAWVEADVRRRVAVQRRKQSIGRQVQRLRTEAQARGALDIPPAPRDTLAVPPPAAPPPSDTTASTPPD